MAAAAPHVGGVLLDIDGVLTVDWKALPGRGRPRSPICGEAGWASAS